MTQLGSDAAAGVVAWSATMLQEAKEMFPKLPTDVIEKPAPSILDVPWVVGPWQVGPEGDPSPGEPQWDWTKIGALVGIGALLVTTLTSSGPLPTPASPRRSIRVHSS